MPQDAEAGGSAQGAIQVARGPRAVEALLLSRVAALIEEARHQPRLLALPVRIVVPSRSLADHVGERIVADTGHSLAGVLVQTLHGLALEMLERAGEPAPASDALFPVLVRRLAAEEPLLREELGALADGYASVEAAVADLLDAGFEAAGAEAVHDALDAAPGDAAALARAHAVARVAERCLSAIQNLGVGHRALLLRAAREVLLADPEVALPARAVIVHGFADATGLRAELLEALVQRRGANVLMDEPPDPAAPSKPDAGCRFSERLRDRLVLAAPVFRAEADSPPETVLELLEASRPDAEAREVAARVRAALDEGIAPERIGIVARDLAGHRAALRRHFHGLGIPFSGSGSGGAGALARRAGALAILLREGADCRTDRWLDAAAPPPGAGVGSALRLALRRLGLLRLRDLAKHEPRTPDEREPVAAARSTCTRLEQMAAGANGTAQLDALERLLREGLGWEPGRAEIAPIREVSAALRADLDGQLPLRVEELALILRRRLARRTAEPLGGAGGGVQVLDAMQARGRTFERLFVLGLVRDAFPRSVREEALLPDFVRERLRDVLSEIPVKRLGHDEERYLFAQLVSASPRVTLSWPRATDEGRPGARSSFIERLLRNPTLAANTRREAATPSLSTLHDRAVRSALDGSTSALGLVLPFVLREMAPSAKGCSPEALAAVRSRIVAEFESGGHPVPRLGPYFGFVGAAKTPADRRAGPLFVTTLQDLAGCGWQTLVRRLLRIAPALDSDDALPGVDGRLLGTVVHRVLETLFSTRDAVDCHVMATWPDDARLEALAREQAREVLAREYVPLAELAHVLARQALPYLKRARALDAADGERLLVLAVESERFAQVSDADGRPRELRFRVDRVERFESVERLTDYKTGKPLSDAVGADTRAEKLARAIAEGSLLQPAAYALSAEAGGVGRLLYLDPELEGRDDAASFEVRRDDPVVAAAFTSAVSALLGAWDEGSFFPRLLDAKLEKDGDACAHCEVASACLQNDTGSRRRFGAWIAEHLAADGSALSDAERALLAVFRLNVRAPKPKRKAAAS